MANMKNSKSHGKQEVDVQKTWKGETRYKSPWLWHGDLYLVSPFQAYRTSISCLPCDLEFFMFAIMKIFVTDISASTGRNDFIFDMWLWHGDLYRVISVTKVFITANMKNVKTCGKQEVDVR
jgi:hypothetical protein